MTAGTRRRIGLVILGCGLLLPRASAAATITLSTASAQGLNLDLGGSLTLVCSDQTSTSSVASGASLTTPCSGGMTLSRGTASYSGSSSATGSFAGTLSLGASASYTVEGDPLLAFFNDDYVAGGSANASFTDSISVFGGPTGTPGTLQLDFTVDGTLSCSSLLGGTGNCSFFPNAGASLSGVIGSQGDSSFLSNGTNAITLDIPILFGQSGTLRIGLSAFGQGELLIGDIQSFDADFLQTATLTNAQVLDANGAPIADGRIVSDSGLLYPTNAAPAPVPEPASLTLLGLGLAGIGARRWRHGKS